MGPLLLKKLQMAVSVDRVYKTVLSILNKEQRGYVTPVEFNQFAVQAQREIFEVYFFKLGKAVAAGGEIDPMVENIPYDIYEKLEPFEAQSPVAYTNFATAIAIPPHYRLSIIQANGITIEKATKTVIGNLHRSPLTEPTTASPKYYRTGDDVFVTGPLASDNIVFFYYTQPTDPFWAGTTAAGQLIPSSAVVDFPLHASEEPELIANILSYAGLSVRAQDVSQAGAQKYTSISQAES